MHRALSGYAAVVSRYGSEYVEPSRASQLIEPPRVYTFRAPLTRAPFASDQKILTVVMRDRSAGGDTSASTFSRTRQSPPGELPETAATSDASRVA